MTKHKAITSSSKLQAVCMLKGLQIILHCCCCTPVPGAAGTTTHKPCDWDTLKVHHVRFDEAHGRPVITNTNSCINTPPSSNSSAACSQHTAPPEIPQATQLTYKELSPSSESQYFLPMSVRHKTSSNRYMTASLACQAVHHTVRHGSKETVSLLLLS